MSRKKIDTFCLRCECAIYNVDILVKYCSDCKKLNRNEAVEKCRNNDKNQEKIKTERDINENLYRENFLHTINLDKHALTPKYFNNHSKIKVKSYVQFFDTDWIGVIRHYGMYDELIKYVKDEYFAFYDSNGSSSFNKFANNHQFINVDFIYTYGFDKIIDEELKSKGIFRKGMVYSEEDLRLNFNIVKEKLKRIPLFKDFDSLTQIPINTYASIHNLKGRVYDEIVRMYTTDYEYKEYLKDRQKHKSRVGKATGILSSNPIPDEVLEIEFRRVFDECFAKFSTYPSRRLFNKISKYDDSLYRNRLNRSWLDVCTYYGYKVEKNHKSEKFVLENIKEIIGVHYIPQKTWDWLIGTGGKNMYCDGYFKDIGLVVEFDGRQHRKPIDAFGGVEAFNRLQANDRLKDELLEENKIKLIRIDSREPWHDINYLAKKLHENNIPIKQEYLDQILSIA